MRHAPIDPIEELLPALLSGNPLKQISAGKKVLSFILHWRERRRLLTIGIEVVCFIEQEKDDRKISFLFRFEGREVGVFAMAKARVLWTSKDANRVQFHFLDDIHSKLFQTIEASFDTSGLYGYQQG